MEANLKGVQCYVRAGLGRTGWAGYGVFLLVGLPGRGGGKGHGRGGSIRSGSMIDLVVSPGHVVHKYGPNSGERRRSSVRLND